MNSITYQTTLIQDISRYLLGNLQFIVESQPEQFEEAAHFELRNISNEVFAQSLEQLDEQFRDSEERKRNYTIKQRRRRTLLTVNGAVTFSQYQYQSRRDGSYYYFIHNFLGLQKYDRISPQLKYEILKKVIKYSYRQISEQFHHAFSHTTVYTVLKSFRQTSMILTPEDFKDKHKIPVLYIQADEIYVSTRNTDRIRNKSEVCNVTLHEGIHTISKGRHSLTNKICFVKDPTEEREEFTERIMKFIQTNYSVQFIYVYGDGAHWIKTMAETIGATYILDWFHTMQALNRIIPRKEVLNKQLKHAIKRNHRQHFEDLIQQNDINWTERRIQSLQYILNNWDSIQQNFNLIFSVGCSQEGLNFHVNARRLTTIPAAWSVDNLFTVATLSSIFNSSSTSFKQVIKQSLQLDTSVHHNSNTNTTYKLRHQMAHVPLLNQPSQYSSWIRNVISPR